MREGRGTTGTAAVRRPSPVPQHAAGVPLPHPQASLARLTNLSPLPVEFWWGSLQQKFREPRALCCQTKGAGRGMDAWEEGYCWCSAGRGFCREALCKLENEASAGVQREGRIGRLSHTHHQGKHARYRRGGGAQQKGRDGTGTAGLATKCGRRNVRHSGGVWLGGAVRCDE